MDAAGRDGARGARRPARECSLSRSLHQSTQRAGLRPSQAQGVSPGFDRRPATRQLRPRCAWAIPHPLRPLTPRTKTKTAKELRPSRRQGVSPPSALRLCRRVIPLPLPLLPPPLAAAGRRCCAQHLRNH